MRWFNQLDFEIVTTGVAASTMLRYTHNGVMVRDFETQPDAANQHTDFYLHPLGQYVQHFAGRDSTYVTVEAPAVSATFGAIDALCRALLLSEGVQAGDTARVTLPELVLLDAVINYRAAHFLGIRTGDALIRCFGRGH